LGHGWAAEWPLEQFHIKFGRIDGMSTRRGDVVLLRDVLDVAKLHTLDRMKATHSKHFTFTDAQWRSQEFATGSA